MDEKRASYITFQGMLSLNVIIILYVTGIMYLVIKGTVYEGTALDFLQLIETVPISPWKIPVISIALYAGLLLFLYIQDENIYVFYCKVVLEIGTSLLLCYLMNFSYTGVLLLVLADVTRRFPNARKKFIMIGVICGIYLLADYNLVSGGFGMTSFESYLSFYQSDVRQILIGVKNVLSSLNVLLFIIYIILLMRLQMSEKERILSLNEQLNAANEELYKANIQMEEYAKTSIKNAETKERNRLAMEIHDTLGHTLTGIITGLDACTTLIEVAPEAAKAQVQLIADVARNGMTDVRRSVKALRPDALEKMELEKALSSMIEESRKSTGTVIDYTCEAEFKSFNKDEEEIIYRIVQESITNAIRHGKADHISIAITMEYNVMNIRVQDNGMGCKEIKDGFGLHHMRERLEMLKGELSVNGENGFLLNAKIPIRWGE